MNAQTWVALVLGAPSLIIAFITWRQRNANDARDQWWKRATWAVDKTLEPDPDASELGTEALLAISAEAAPKGIDRQLLRTFAAQRLVHTRPRQNEQIGENEATLDGGDEQ